MGARPLPCRRRSRRPRDRQRRISQGRSLRGGRVSEGRPAAWRHRRVSTADWIQVAADTRRQIESRARSRRQGRADRAGRRSHDQHARRSGAAARGADRLRGPRSAHSRSEVRRPRGPRPPRQGRPVLVRRSVPDSRTAALPLPVRPLELPEGNRRGRHDVDYRSAEHGHSVGALDPDALPAFADAGRPGAGRDCGAEAGGYDQPGARRNVLRGNGPHLQGHSRACRSRQAAADVRAAGIAAGHGRSGVGGHRIAQRRRTAAWNGSGPEGRVRRAVGASRSRGHRLRWAGR